MISSHYIDSIIPLYYIRVFVSCILSRVYIFWQRSCHIQLSYNLVKDNKVSYQLRLILLWWVKDCPRRMVGWTVCLEQKLAPCLSPKEIFSYFCMGDGLFKTYLKICSCGLLVMDFTYIVACNDVVIKLPCYFQEKKLKNKNQIKSANIKFI